MLPDTIVRGRPHRLLDIMYDLPSMKNVTKVVVDEAVVNGASPPFLIFSGGEKQLAASD